MAYTPPPIDSVDFTLIVYTPPAISDVDFELEEGLPWLTGWTYRKKITISNTNVDADLANFPVYVPIVNDANIGAVCESDGGDIRFTRSDGQTELSYEKFYFAVAVGQANGDFYVLVNPVTTAAVTEIYCYYGKSAATTTSSPTSVFAAGNNWGAVWHLEENANPYLDATVNDNDSIGGTYPVRATGQVAYCQEFEYDSGQYFYVADKASLNFGAGDDFTISFWVNKESLSYDYVLRKDFDPNPYYTIYLNDNRPACQIGDGASHFATCVAWDDTLSTATWYHVCVRLDHDSPTGLSIWINGANNSGGYSANPTAVGTLTNNIKLTIGARSEYGENSIDGKLDEMRISRVWRPNAWVKFEYYNMQEGHAVGNELTWAAQESMEVSAFLMCIARHPSRWPLLRR